MVDARKIRVYWVLAEERVHRGEVEYEVDMGGGEAGGKFGVGTHRCGRQVGRGGGGVGEWLRLFVVLRLFIRFKTGIRFSSLRILSSCSFIGLKYFMHAQ